MVLVITLLLFLLSGCNLTAGLKESDVEPYAIFSSFNYIIKVSVVEPFPKVPQVLLRVQRSGISGVDYHYRMNLMFWTNSLFGEIWKASLSNGSDETRIMSGLGDPTDVAVDWINDKLYFTERRAGKIGEYDLNTGKRKEVLATGRGSMPENIAVYPFPNYGWVFWSDTQRQTIERVGVDGQGREVIRNGLGRCVKAISLDYILYTIFWTDTCIFRVESVRMDGNRTSNSVLVPLSSLNSGGITILDDYLYWTDSSSSQQNAIIRRVNKTRGEPVVQISYGLNALLGGIEIVHPSKQPDADDFLNMLNVTNATCLSCVNGICVPPAKCSCFDGWMGPNCDLDIDECEEGTSDCTQICNNEDGGYFCTCIDGYEIDSDNRTCIGLLGAVANLTVVFEESSFKISWDYQFSFIVPLVTFCINITNSSSDEEVVSECGIRVTQYSFQQDYDPCMVYAVTVIPVNRVSTGISTQTYFPVPGYVRSEDVTAIVMTGGNFTYRIPTRPYPVCSCEVTIFDTRPITTSCTVNGANISFTSGGIALNKFYTANITLLNGRISSSSVITISTYDVQKLTVNNSVPNTISFIAGYALNSNARGVLIVMIFIYPNLEVANFDLSVYVVVDRVISTPSLPNIRKGTYITLAYDIEMDGLLKLGRSFPAYGQIVDVTGTDEVKPSLPDNDNMCKVIAVNNYINVTCDFTDADITGYQAILQSSRVGTLIVKQFNINTFLIFEALNNGPHSVTVLPIMDNGGLLSGGISRGVHRETIIVTGTPPCPAKGLL